MTKKKKPTLNKIYIVIEDTGKQGGQAFDVRLEGYTRNIEGLDEKDMTPAEIWGERLFNVCFQVLEQTGCVQNVRAEPGFEPSSGTQH